MNILNLVSVAILVIASFGFAAVAAFVAVAVRAQMRELRNQKALVASLKAQIAALKVARAHEAAKAAETLNTAVELQEWLRKDADVWYRRYLDKFGEVETEQAKKAAVMVELRKEQAHAAELAKAGAQLFKLVQRERAELHAVRAELAKWQAAYADLNDELKAANADLTVASNKLACVDVALKFYKGRKA